MCIRYTNLKAVMVEARRPHLPLTQSSKSPKATKFALADWMSPGGYSYFYSLATQFALGVSWAQGDFIFKCCCWVIMELASLYYEISNRIMGKNNRNTVKIAVKIMWNKVYKSTVNGINWSAAFTWSKMNGYWEMECFHSMLPFVDLWRSGSF